MLGKRFFDLFHGRSASVVPRSCRSFGSSCRETVLCLRMSDKNWLNLDAKRIFLSRVIDYTCLSTTEEISTFSYISHQSEPLWPESINNLIPQHTVNYTFYTPPGQKQKVAIKKKVMLSYFAELPLALIMAYSCCGSASISFDNVPGFMSIECYINISPRFCTDGESYHWPPSQHIPKFLNGIQVSSSQNHSFPILSPMNPCVIILEDARNIREQNIHWWNN